MTNPATNAETPAEFADRMLDDQFDEYDESADAYDDSPVGAITPPARRGDTLRLTMGGEGRLEL